MAGKNIKQLISRVSPALTDFMYLVAGDNDYNVTLSAIKELFGIDDVEKWAVETILAGETNYVQLGSSLTYAGFVLEYVAKRGSRAYHQGQLRIAYDGTDIDADDIWDKIDEDDLGLSVVAQVSSGEIQINISADSSDAEDLLFNYKIIHKKPITVGEEEEEEVPES